MLRLGLGLIFTIGLGIGVSITQHATKISFTANLPF